MSASKVVFLILIFIAVLFLVALFLRPGSGSDEVLGSDPAHPNTSTKAATSFSTQNHPALMSLNDLVAPFAPKLSQRALVPDLTTFDLARTPAYQTAVLPDSSQTFRIAQFLASPSKNCAIVVYTPADRGGFGDGKPQASDDSASNGDPKKFSFTITSSGGTLTVRRSNPLQAVPCTVTLQAAK